MDVYIAHSWLSKRLSRKEHFSDAAYDNTYLGIPNRVLTNIYGFVWMWANWHVNTVAGYSLTVKTLFAILVYLFAGVYSTFFFLFSGK